MSDKPEVVAWICQHEDTGTVDFVDTQQIEWGFEKNNPRIQVIAPLIRLSDHEAAIAADKARIDELERSSIALINAAKALRKETPSMSCECFHHSKADRHESDEECPPFERWCVAALNLNKALAQQGKGGGE